MSSRLEIEFHSILFPFAEIFGAFYFNYLRRTRIRPATEVDRSFKGPISKHPSQLKQLIVSNLFKTINSELSNSVKSKYIWQILLFFYIQPAGIGLCTDNFLLKIRPK